MAVSHKKRKEHIMARVGAMLDCIGNTVHVAAACAWHSPNNLLVNIFLLNVRMH